MIERKKKLKIIQLGLLIIGILIIYFTYINKNAPIKNEIVTKADEEQILTQLSNNSLDEGDVFYNIKYSGFDLAGNRYTLRAIEAYNSKSKQELVDMKFVEVFFYFKDNTFLEVTSETGVYNNKTLDMKFETNVKAYYEGNELFAEKAEYLNLDSFLTISKNVKLNSEKGSIKADKLVFDIKNQQLNIASSKDNKINANIVLNEKRF